MKHVIVLGLLFIGLTINAQVEFVIVCNQTSMKLEVTLSAKVSNQQKILKKGFPNQSAAEGYLNDNRGSLNCGQPPNPTTTRATRSNPPKQNHMPIASAGGGNNNGSIDIHGVWYNDKNKCLATFYYTGKHWVATIHRDSENSHLKEGEIVAELYPEKKNKVKGRMKIMKKYGKFEWKEVEYKMELTQLKGKHSWKFYAPAE